ncbi:MAG: hypothetical protein ACKV2T_38000 [Kofleriaceae bacterium]
MEDLINSITMAISPDASPEARANGAAACRCIITALEPTPTALIPSDAMPQLIAMLGKMDLNQLLDVAIERLRALNAAKPSSSPDPAPRPINFQLVPVPRVPR